VFKETFEAPLALSSCRQAAQGCGKVELMLEAPHEGIQPCGSVI
jgi:hypothetical protein